MVIQSPQIVTSTIAAANPFQSILEDSASTTTQNYLARHTTLLGLRNNIQGIRGIRNSLLKQSSSIRQNQLLELVQNGIQESLAEKLRRYFLILGLRRNFKFTNSQSSPPGNANNKFSQAPSSRQTPGLQNQDGLFGQQGGQENPKAFPPVNNDPAAVQPFMPPAVDPVQPPADVVPPPADVVPPAPDVVAPPADVVPPVEPHPDDDMPELDPNFQVPDPVGANPDPVFCPEIDAPPQPADVTDVPPETSDTGSFCPEAEAPPPPPPPPPPPAPDMGGGAPDMSGGAPCG